MYPSEQRSYRRCSVCSISYPANTEFDECKVCGDPTKWMKGSGPDADWKERVNAAVAMREACAAMSEEHVVGDPVQSFRRDEFFKLGFTLQQAEVLSKTKDRDGPQGIYLWWSRVGEVLERCKAKGHSDPHGLVFDIFT